MNLILLCFQKLWNFKNLNTYISKLVLWHLSTSSTSSSIWVPPKVLHSTFMKTEAKIRLNTVRSEQCHSVMKPSCSATRVATMKGQRISLFLKHSGKVIWFTRLLLDLKPLQNIQSIHSSSCSNFKKNCRFFPPARGQNVPKNAEK